MAYQAVFKRYEIKYLLDARQCQRLMQTIEPYMALDQYGRTTIRNLYFDTDNYRLIRRSIEKPVYKEKLRIRSYRQVQPDSPVFVELKKKYSGVVYKRRLSMPYQQAVDWLSGSLYTPEACQISREIDYTLKYYETLRPKVFLSYERRAFYCRQGGDFRLTLDENILARRQELSLAAPIYGAPLLPEGKVLMELKTPGGIPLWLTEFLSREKLYKAPFSKYATAYEQMILPKFKGECLYA